MLVTVTTTSSSGIERTASSWTTSLPEITTTSLMTTNQMSIRVNLINFRKPTFTITLIMISKEYLRLIKPRKKCMMKTTKHRKKRTRTRIITMTSRCLRTMNITIGCSSCTNIGRRPWIHSTCGVHPDMECTASSPILRATKQDSRVPQTKQGSQIIRVITRKNRQRRATISQSKWTQETKIWMGSMVRVRCSRHTRSTQWTGRSISRSLPRILS